jgi:hypothetical protein
MDYLPIQASSVPCEQVFSSAGETDTKKRNWISLALMEALQMLKFLLKKECLNFMAGWKMEESEMLRGSRTEKGSQLEIMLSSLLGEDIKRTRYVLLIDDMNIE